MQPPSEEEGLIREEFGDARPKIGTKSLKEIFVGTAEWLSFICLLKNITLTQDMIAFFYYFLKCNFKIKVTLTAKSSGVLS